MASITFAVDDELKSGMSEFSWINWSELIRITLLERKRQAEHLLKRLHSKEEQELIRWSVELGREAKKGSFKRLLSRVSPKIRGELLSSMSPKERKEYE
mgnify:CR=1 FL=1